MPKYTFVHGQPTSDGNLRLIKRHTAAAANRRKRLGERAPAPARVGSFQSHVATLNFKETSCSCKEPGKHSSGCARRSTQGGGVSTIPSDDTLVQANSRAPSGMLVWEKRTQGQARKILPKTQQQASIPPPITPPQELRLPEIIFKCSSDFISSTFFSWMVPTSPSEAATSTPIASAWSPLPTTYLLLFKLAFDIIDAGTQFTTTAFQIFDVLLTYAPHLLKLQTPSGLFAYMFLIVRLLAPACGVGQAPGTHGQLRALLRRQLTLTARVILGHRHPVTVVCEALLSTCVDPQMVVYQPQIEDRSEASNVPQQQVMDKTSQPRIEDRSEGPYVCLQQVVNKTRDIWGQSSMQHMIVACHYEGELRGDGLQVAWEHPAENPLPADEALLHTKSPAQRHRIVPAMDEVAVVSPANGGTLATFSMSVPSLHTQVPALSALIPVAMKLFAAVDDLQRAGLSRPIVDRAESNTEVADATRALLDCMATDEAVKVNLGWRMRADGNYALAIQQPAEG